jgi:hypothetical protein
LKIRGCLESGPPENEDKFQVRPEFLKGKKFEADLISGGPISGQPWDHPDFQTDPLPDLGV